MKSTKEKRMSSRAEDRSRGGVHPRGIMKKFIWINWGPDYKICRNANITCVEDVGDGYEVIIRSAQNPNGKWTAEGSCLKPGDESSRPSWNPKDSEILSGGDVYVWEKNAIQNEILRLITNLVMYYEGEFDEAFIKTLKALKKAHG